MSRLPSFTTPSGARGCGSARLPLAAALCSCLLLLASCTPASCSAHSNPGAGRNVTKHDDSGAHPPEPIVGIAVERATTHRRRLQQLGAPTQSLTSGGYAYSLYSGSGAARSHRGALDACTSIGQELSPYQSQQAAPLASLCGAVHACWVHENTVAGQCPYRPPGAAATSLPTTWPTYSDCFAARAFVCRVPQPSQPTAPAPPPATTAPARATAAPAPAPTSAPSSSGGGSSSKSIVGSDGRTYSLQAGGRDHRGALDACTALGQELAPFSAQQPASQAALATLCGTVSECWVNEATIAGQCPFRPTSGSTQAQYSSCFLQRAFVCRGQLQPSQPAAASPPPTTVAPAPAPTTAAATPAPTAAPAPAPTAAPATSAPAVAGGGVKKKGVAAFASPAGGAALRDSGVGWFYTWSTDPKNQGFQATDVPAGVQFVPMIHRAMFVTATELEAAKRWGAGGSPLLGFNEPDLPEQANMGVEQALSLWPQLVATGMRLGSPVVAMGADQAGGWLDRFMSGARAQGLRVDFIPLHWYGWDYDATRATAQLKSYIEAVRARYNLPIWVTEFALINWSTNPPTFPSWETQGQFARQAAAMMGGLPYVERYAWFSLTPFATSGAQTTHLYNTDGTATPQGQVYKSL